MCSFLFPDVSLEDVVKDTVKDMELLFAAVSGRVGRYFLKNSKGLRCKSNQGGIKRFVSVHI